MLSQAMKIVKSVLVFTYSCCLGMTIQPPMYVLGDIWSQPFLGVRTQANCVFCIFA